jgi:hypothetical protein
VFLSASHFLGNLFFSDLLVVVAFTVANAVVANAVVVVISFLASRDLFLAGLWHERVARGDHGLPKVSSGPAMPYPNPSTPDAPRVDQEWPA